MKAVMYGAGNIGRGFIGALLSRSGYGVTFIDVSQPVIDAINRDGQYPVRIVSGDGYEEMTVSGVSAVNGNDGEIAADTIAEADLLATAVGVNALKFIIPNLAEGLRRRFRQGERPLNILICENLMDANHVLERMIKEQLTEGEQKLFDQRVGLVEASIGRMVPVQTPEMQDGNPLRVCVERYGFLPVDRDAFKGEIPQVQDMVPFSPFDYYLKRKLYVHNMGHATCAYLGGYLGLEYIYQAIDNPDVLVVVQNAMTESARALSRKYGVPLEEVLLNVQDLLRRFTNSALGDTCARVGGDLPRKLAPADRLIGSSLLCLEQGIRPVHICAGIAGAVLQKLREDGGDQTEEAALAVLKELSGLEGSHPLLEDVLPLYRVCRDGGSVTDLRRRAGELAGAHMEPVI